ncbi:MAG: hypothetical protein ACRDFX_14550 [Chloroflexota bacterium]
MKNVFDPTVITDWLRSWLPGNLFGIAPKTPWYQRTLQENRKWIAIGVGVPLAGVLAWQGVTRLWPASHPEPHK